MSFSADAAEEFGIPLVFFWTASAFGFVCYMHYHKLAEKGLIPLKDMSYVTNGYLETTLDWVPGIKEIRLRDMPSFLRTTDLKDIMLDFFLGECARAHKASAIVMNTFDALEHDVLEACSSLHNNTLPPIYPIGPLNFQLNRFNNEHLNKILSSLWKEDLECLEWLDKQEPNSVVYVNFGSITTMTNEQLIEFAWGLANSNKKFFWVIRPDLVGGENAVLPNEFVEETKIRGMISNWCPQEQVLAHPSIGVFLTHCGWNSTLESICGGVPMICWPFFAEQQTNCRFCNKEWGNGLEIEDVNGWREGSRYEREGLGMEEIGQGCFCPKWILISQSRDGDSSSSVGQFHCYKAIRVHAKSDGKLNAPFGLKILSSKFGPTPKSDANSNTKLQNASKLSHSQFRNNPKAPNLLSRLRASDRDAIIQTAVLATADLRQLNAVRAVPSYVVIVQPSLPSPHSPPTSPCSLCPSSPQKHRGHATVAA
ncbi:hypothetical protein PIB30_033356 [Stylosanthes scabra]|uniref:Glycosyltransferase n=1 Tax=Stylosanthes scabra TaxID=79078 RepID=A0ABU6XE42_9FABA|nr:hypothetical protein [Stylosanthes scabra]